MRKVDPASIDTAPAHGSNNAYSEGMAFYRKGLMLAGVQAGALYLATVLICTFFILSRQWGNDSFLSNLSLLGTALFNAAIFLPFAIGYLWALAGPRPKREDYDTR